jgi:uncharacterized membrane protein YkvA (DUF1232 family)
MGLRHDPVAFPTPDLFMTLQIAARLRTWARHVKRDGVTLWFAGKDRRTPWHAKALGVFVVAYALSPIDLIPDFIPVLGYVDDVLLLPALIWFAIRLVPPDVLAECRVQADEWMRTRGAKPTSRLGAVVIVLLWVAVTAAAVGWWLRSRS